MSHFGTGPIRTIHTGTIQPRLLLTLIVVIAVAILLYCSLAYVPAGHVGVLTSFGRVTGEVLPEGTHFVSPFKINHVMSIRTQSQEEHTSTPSSEGLNLEIDTSLIYHLNPEKAAAVFQGIGSEYASTIVTPTLTLSNPRYDGRTLGKYSVLEFPQAGGRRD